MGNVMRVLGIVLASMLLGLTGLFLLLFTICGGLKSSDGGGVLAVCLLLIVGGVGLIVFLGRGIVATRAASPGLAVPPASAAPAFVPPSAHGAAAASTYGGAPTITPQTPYAPPTSAGYPPHTPPAPAASAAPPRPVLPLRSLAGTDLQALVGLRVCLAIIILLSLGLMALNFVNFGRFGTNVAIQLSLQSILGLLPPVALLVAVSVRNPPAGGALDALAGFGIASILFRFGYLGFAGAFVHAISQGDYLLTMLPRLVGYSALEAGIAGLALYLRSRVGPINAATLIVATLAFLFWEGLAQAIMTAMIGLLY
jgi:hypothetical protein